MDSLTEKWHVVAVDLKFNRFYVLLADQTRDDCDEVIRDWGEQELPDVVPVAWPAKTPLPKSLFAA